MKHMAEVASKYAVKRQASLRRVGQGGSDGGFADRRLKAVLDSKIVRKIYSAVFFAILAIINGSPE